MPVYKFTCSAGETEEVCSFEDYPGETSPCPCGCGGTRTRVYFAPQIVCPDNPLPIRKPGINVSKFTDSPRSPQAQEKAYSRLIEKRRKLIKEKKRSLSKKPDTRMDHAGTIPRELYMSRMAEYGKNYWTDQDPRKALKREGLLLDED